MLTFKLNNGREIPAVGFGTWQTSDEETIACVSEALKAGYRHIDTAFSYGNEVAVGKAIKDSGIPREEIWITSKLANQWHSRAAEQLQKSLDNLGVDYLDLFLVHFPCSTDPEDAMKHLPDWDFVKTWQLMQKFLEGKVKTIGVSNFQIRHLEKLLSDPSCKVVPAVNQIELHPYNPSHKLLQYCHSKGIHCTAYCCLGASVTSADNNHTHLINDTVVAGIAEARGKSPAQILLKWGLARGTSVIPRSLKPARIQQNFDLEGWELTTGELAQIDRLKTRAKAVGDSWMPIRVFFGDDE
ncbi:hypothetical protein KEM56_007160 [Ascosphaera pollenicola]|nr:hypothetical protein KEM56_007160 [Ascosphaera pollenicola]